MRRLPWTLLVLAASVAPAAADEKPKTPPTDPNLVEVRFADGSAVKFVLLHDSLDVTTRFSKLTVPLRDLRRVELGLRYPDGVQQKIQDAVGLLSNPDFKKREAAQAELISYRELAYPLVVEATRSHTPETAKRARAIVEEIRRKVPEEKLAVKPYDEVVTSDFPVRGRLELAALKARSPVFGEATLKLTEVRSIRAVGNVGEVQVSIDAARHGLVHENWLETEVEVGGQVLEIVAGGQVDLYPFGGERGMYLATPDGSRPGGQPTPHPSGALLGRVGPRGKPFVVGRRFEGVPPGEGRLYLRIEASPWRVVPSGSYTVKIAGR